MSKKVKINLYKGTDGQYNSALVFDLDDVSRLRNLGICGVLSGTLPSATQQNLFLTVPLRLMFEEVIWLYINGHANINVYADGGQKAIADAVRNKYKDLAEAYKSQLEKSFQFQREYKKEQHRKKLEQLGVVEKARTSEDRNEDKLIHDSLFVETTNDSVIIKGPSMEDLNAFFDKIIPELFKNIDSYILYQSLRNQGYFLSPGARFGGKYIAYPGDPLRYHSHLTIQDAIDYYDESINLLLLLSGARLGTTVKKLWVFGGSKRKANKIDELKDVNNDDISFYSVEWAGFG
ncbi:tRNA-splicing endonuclease subunit SEN34 [Nakaseomyces bracarensis]|uniref:tRNA-splicing endonuclease subunit Sen34 n=1 Tax=Nakaseomyces bracarensis TaxID=273131 RepID=A0ABR4NRZ0_9SACH